jgi:hypothetical protein
MSDYSTLKNAAIIETISTPTSNTDLGTVENTYGNIYLSGNVNLNGVDVNSTNVLGPKVATITYTGDDTAADPAGGQTVTLTGSGFNLGASVLISGVSPNVVTRVSSTVLTFTAPAQSVGNYTLYVINPDGGTAIFLPGMSYSGTPTWSTSSGSLGITGSGGSTAFTVVATGDAPVTYSVTTGGLPAGVTLNASTGVISGTAPVLASTTTYNFTVTATDAQNQETPRNFSITVNVNPSATGGTVTTVGDYKIHTFTSSDSVIFSSGGSAQYLVVAGGGAGGTGNYGGGGGAGGFLTGNVDFSSATYTVTVGAGGIGQGSQSLRGGNGANSVISGTGVSVTAVGGGGGGSRNNDAAGGNSGGAPGGSGGGASFVSSAGGKGVYPGSTFIDAPRQGYDGGTNPAGQYAAGGGGAGGVGHDGTNFANRSGGAGLANPITGSTAGVLSVSTYYLAGGGSGNFNGGSPYALGGAVGGAGTAGSGAGGLGGFSLNGAGSAGGSGVVVIKYKFQ